MTIQKRVFQIAVGFVTIGGVLFSVDEWLSGHRLFAVAMLCFYAGIGAFVWGSKQ